MIRITNINTNIKWIIDIRNSNIISFTKNPLANSNILGELFTAISQRVVVNLKYHLFPEPDVTKSVADMILTDDNFATIVAAVGEGRRIYQNIRKAIQFLLSSNLSEVIGIFFGVFLLFFMLKAGLYTIVNNVFFDSKKNLQWMKTLLFVISAEGVLLFPCVMLLTYFNLSMQSVLYYFVIVLFFVKLLTFYKSWLIFFRQKGLFLQNILYFCALEITPLLAFGSMMVMITNSLKINF